MKGFPHQYNDLGKLRGTLATCRDLDAAGERIDDDGVLGYELARRQIYRFRGLDYDAGPAAVQQAVADRIAVEQDRPASTQGARTAARDMRRTLRYLGWLTPGNDITALGDDVLASAPSSPDELVLVASSVLGIEVVDQAGNRSHPARILLRLIGDRTFSSRDGMEVALEAFDDTEAEYQRVLGLLALPKEQRRAAMRATEFSMANAVKILPSFLLQAGLIFERADRTYALTAAGAAALRGAYAAGPIAVAGGRPSAPPRPRRSGRATTRRPGATAPGDLGRRRSGTPGRPLTPEEQAEATRLLFERTDRHQEVVRRLGRHGGRAALFEDPLAYDLVMAPPEPLDLVLWEVKTIAGDGDAQVRLAVGQLAFYEHFHVRRHWPGRSVVQAVAVDRAVDTELCDFLSSLGIAAVLVDDDGSLQALNDEGKDVLRLVDTL